MINEFINRNKKNNKIKYFIIEEDKIMYTKENSKVITNNFYDYFINTVTDLLN